MGVVAKVLPAYTDRRPIVSLAQSISSMSIAIATDNAARKFLHGSLVGMRVKLSCVVSLTWRASAVQSRK